MMMGFGFLGLFLMLLFWIGLIGGAVFLVRAVFPAGNQSTPTNRLADGNARQILDERYTRGEISRAEYEGMREDIS